MSDLLGSVYRDDLAVRIKIGPLAPEGSLWGACIRAQWTASIPLSLKPLDLAVSALRRRLAVPVGTRDRAGLSGYQSGVEHAENAVRARALEAWIVGARAGRTEAFPVDFHIITAAGTHLFVSDFPVPLADWDDAGNPGRTPQTTRAGQSEPAAWKCSVCGNKWPASVYTRTKLGTGCPKCKDVIRRETHRTPNEGQSFLDWEPVLSLDWSDKNETSPADHNYGSAFVAIWDCRNQGHSFERALDQRRRRPDCPKCFVAGTSKWELLTSASLLALGVPVVAPAPRIPVAGRKRPISVDIVIDEWKVAIECDGFYWHRNSQASDLANTGLLVAAGWNVIRVRAGLEEISDLDVVVAANPTVEDTVIAICDRLRQMGHAAPSTAQIRSSDHAAPTLPTIRSRYRIPALADSYAGEHPEVAAAEWSDKNDRRPDEVTSGSGYDAIWDCSRCGVEWTAFVVRRSPTLWCWPCSQNFPRLNDSIEVLRPDMAAQWSSKNKLTPADVRPGNSTLQVLWDCPCGNEYQTTPAHKSVAKYPCPECANAAARGPRKPAPGRSVTARRPDLCPEWSSENELGPDEVSAGSKTWVKWDCLECGDTYSMMVVLRTSGGQRHPKCAHAAGSRKKSKPAPGQSLGDLLPLSLTVWGPNKFTPFDVGPGSGKRAVLTCPNNHHLPPRRIVDAVASGFRCRLCPKGSRKPSERALLAAALVNGPAAP